MEATTPTTRPTPTAPPTGINKSALIIVFLVVFIDLLGFGIVLPLLPRFAEDYVDTLLVGGRENRLGGLIIGLLMSSFSLMQFLFAPVWGRISDRVGRRPILLLGLGGSVLVYLLFGYALPFTGEQAGVALALLFAARIGAGIAGATISTAQAVIADSTPPEHRKHGMAIIGAAFGIGFTFGPLIGAVALVWFPADHQVIGYFAAGLSLVALILGVRLLPETRRAESLGPPRRLLNWGAMGAALRSPAIGPVILTFFLATLGFGAMEATLALVLKDALQSPESRSYLYFAYVGFILLLTQGFLYRRLAKRLSEPTFMLIGILLMACGVGTLGAVTYGAAQTSQVSSTLVALLFFALTTAVVGYAFLTPSAQALVSRRTDASQQGEILGVNQSAAAMARILGPVLGVSLYKLTDTHLWPYALGAALLVLMVPLMPRIRRGGDAPAP